MQVTYHNPDRRDLFPGNGKSVRTAILHLADRRKVEFPEGIIREPYARMVRAGQVTGIDIYFQAEGEFDR